MSEKDPKLEIYVCKGKDHSVVSLAFLGSFCASTFLMPGMWEALSQIFFSVNTSPKFGRPCHYRPEI